MNKLESLTLIFTTIINFYAMATFSSPPDCHQETRQDGTYLVCQPKSAGIGALSTLALGVQGYLAYQGLKKGGNYVSNVSNVSDDTFSMEVEEKSQIDLGKKILDGPLLGWSQEVVNPKSKKDFEEVLRRPDSVWVARAVYANNLILSGAAGSGKTTLAITITFLRQLLLGHRVVVGDPHAHENPWPEEIWKVKGHKMNYGEIALELRACKDRMAIPIGAGELTTSIWDEMTNYAENIPEETDGFFKKVAADSRKSIESVIFLAHNLTQSSLGGANKKTGWSELVRRMSTLDLEYTYDDKTHKPRPSYQGVARNLALGPKKGQIDEAPITYPDWLKNPMLNETLFNLVNR